MGNLDKQVFKAPREFTRLREYSRIHMTLVRDTVRVQARIVRRQPHCPNSCLGGSCLGRAYVPCRSEPSRRCRTVNLDPSALSLADCVCSSGSRKSVESGQFASVMRRRTGVGVWAEPELPRTFCALQTQRLESQNVLVRSCAARRPARSFRVSTTSHVFHLGRDQLNALRCPRARSSESPRGLSSSRSRKAKAVRNLSDRL